MNLFHTAFAGGAPSFWIGAAALWLFSAAVSAMNPPQKGDSEFYGWLFRFTHLLAANLDRVLKTAAIDKQPTDIPNQERQ